MPFPNMYDPLGRRSGSGIFKAFVALGIIVISGVILVALFGSGISNISGRTHDLAQKEADKFVSSIPGASAHCAGIDSDGDGYVSCTYITADGNAHPLECAGAFNLNTGCRTPKAVLTNPSGR